MSPSAFHVLLPLLLVGALLAPDVDARTNLGWVLGAKEASCTAACAGHGGCSTSRPGFAKNANDDNSDTLLAALLGAYGNNVGCTSNNCDRNAPADGQGVTCGTEAHWPNFGHARYCGACTQNCWYESSTDPKDDCDLVDANSERLCYCLDVAGDCINPPCEPVPDPVCTANATLNFFGDVVLQPGILLANGTVVVSHPNCTANSTVAQVCTAAVTVVDGSVITTHPDCSTSATCATYHAPPINTTCAPCVEPWTNNARNFADCGCEKKFGVTSTGKWYAGLEVTACRCKAQYATSHPSAAAVDQIVFEEGHNGQNRTMPNELCMSEVLAVARSNGDPDYILAPHSTASKAIFDVRPGSFAAEMRSCPDGYWPLDAVYGDTKANCDAAAAGMTCPFPGRPFATGDDIEGATLAIGTITSVPDGEWYRVAFKNPDNTTSTVSVHTRDAACPGMISLRGITESTEVGSSGNPRGCYLEHDKVRGTSLNWNGGQGQQGTVEPADRQRVCMREALWPAGFTGPNTTTTTATTTTTTATTTTIAVPPPPLDYVLGPKANDSQAGPAVCDGYLCLNDSAWKPVLPECPGQGDIVDGSWPMLAEISNMSDCVAACRQLINTSSQVNGSACPDVVAEHYYNGQGGFFTTLGRVWDVASQEKLVPRNPSTNGTRILDDIIGAKNPEDYPGGCFLMHTPKVIGGAGNCVPTATEPCVRMAFNTKGAAPGARSRPCSDPETRSRPPSCPQELFPAHTQLQRVCRKGAGPLTSTTTTATTTTLFSVGWSEVGSVECPAGSTRVMDAEGCKRVGYADPGQDGFTKRLRREGTAIAGYRGWSNWPAGCMKRHNVENEVGGWNKEQNDRNCDNDYQCQPKVVLYFNDDMDDEYDQEVLTLHGGNAYGRGAKGPVQVACATPYTTQYGEWGSLECPAGMTPITDEAECAKMCETDQEPDFTCEVKLSAAETAVYLDRGYVLGDGVLGPRYTGEEYLGWNDRMERYEPNHPTGCIVMEKKVKYSTVEVMVFNTAPTGTGLANRIARPVCRPGLPDLPTIEIAVLDLDFNTTDMVQLENTTRLHLKAAGVKTWETVKIKFTEGSVIVAVTTRDADDLALINATQQNATSMDSFAAELTAAYKVAVGMTSTTATTTTVTTTAEPRFVCKTEMAYPGSPDHNGSIPQSAMCDGFPNCDCGEDEDKDLCRAQMLSQSQPTWPEYVCQHEEYGPCDYRCKEKNATTPTATGGATNTTGGAAKTSAASTDPAATDAGDAGNPAPAPSPTPGDANRGQVVIRKQVKKIVPTMKLATKMPEGTCEKQTASEIAANVASMATASGKVGQLDLAKSGGTCEAGRRRAASKDNFAVTFAFAETVTAAQIEAAIKEVNVKIESGSFTVSLAVDGKVVQAAITETATKGEKTVTVWVETYAPNNSTSAPTNSTNATTAAPPAVAPKAGAALAGSSALATLLLASGGVAATLLA